jgi:hypothetical protein
MYWERLLDLGFFTADDDDRDDIQDRAQAEAISEIAEGCSVVLPEEQQRIDTADALVSALTHLYAYAVAPEAFGLMYRRRFLAEALIALKRAEVPAAALDHIGPEKEIPL